MSKSKPPSFLQMFVFAVYKQTREESPMEGYVLLPPVVFRDYQEIVEFLGRHVIILKPSEEYPALKSATESGNYEMFEASLEVGDECTERTNTGDPIPLICSYRNCELLLRTLFQIPFRFGVGPRRIFLQRIHKGGGSSVETLTKILSGTVELKYRTERGETFLHVATAIDNTALLTVALQTCFRVDEQNDYGQSALHIASALSCRNSTQLLLENGANVNLVYPASRSGETPLFTDNVEILSILLNFGANINHANADGETLLCCFRGYSEYSSTCQVLLDFDFNCVLETDYPNHYCSDLKIRVERQAIKLSALGFKLLPIPVPCVDQTDDFPRDCEAEVTRLKEERVGGTHLTFYDIVTKGTYRNSCNVKNKNFIQVLQSNDYKSMFPIYASLIECEFTKGLYRRKFLDRGVTVILSLAAKFSCLPFEIIEEIIRFLTNEEIMKMSLNITL